MRLSVFFLLLPHLRVAEDSPCICTTVPCPEVGENNIIMGKGGANITYYYEEHNNIPVVVKGAGIINQLSLHNGT